MNENSLVYVFKNIIIILIDRSNLFNDRKRKFYINLFLLIKSNF